MRLSDEYMHQYNIPTLVQLMACRLFGTKPLSQPKLPYCQLDPKEHISVKFYLKFNFSFKEIHLEMSAKWRPFCLSLNVLTTKETLKMSFYNDINAVDIWLVLMVYQGSFCVCAQPMRDDVTIGWAHIQNDLCKYSCIVSQHNVMGGMLPSCSNNECTCIVWYQWAWQM